MDLISSKFHFKINLAKILLNYVKLGVLNGDFALNGLFGHEIKNHRCTIKTIGVLTRVK